MRFKFLYLILALLIVLFGIVFYELSQSSQPTPPPKSAVSIPASPEIKPTSFKRLPGWQSTQALVSLRTFQRSCRQVLKHTPEHSMGNRWFELQAKDWQPPCAAAVALHTHSETIAKEFFETWFQPMEFVTQPTVSGLFTGYYLPAVAASLHKTKEYSIPIYGVPTNLVHINLHDFDPNLPSRQLVGRLEKQRIVPFYSREEIDQGNIAEVAPVLAYVRNPMDRLLMEIQGSAILNFDDGSQINLGYAAKNGLPYTAIGRVLIERKILPAQEVSIQSIRAYLKAHPEEQADIIHKNRSFVFFQTLQRSGAFGTQGTRLTQGYSLAVDPEWVPLGMPVWLSTTYPDPHSNTQHPLDRLMIAQDTGGAIKGTVRGDVYWGHGEEAAAIAGKMKSPGRYWLLVPKTYQLRKIT